MKAKKVDKMAAINLGLGAAPGYLGGDNEADILEVYQRYQLYRALTEEGPGGRAGNNLKITASQHIHIDSFYL